MVICRMTGRTMSNVGQLSHDDDIGIPRERTVPRDRSVGDYECQYKVYEAGIVVEHDTTNWRLLPYIYRAFLSYKKTNHSTVGLKFRTFITHWIAHEWQCYTISVCGSCERCRCSLSDTIVCLPRSTVLKCHSHTIYSMDNQVYHPHWKFVSSTTKGCALWKWRSICTLDDYR